MNNNELIEKVTEALASTKSAHKRLDKLEELSDAIYSLTTDVKVLTEQLVNLKTDVIEIKNKPNKITDTIITVITSSITVALLSLILK